MSNEIKTMSQEKKNKIGNWLSWIVVIISILIPIGFVTGSDLMMWCFIILNLVFGPVCLIFYLLEVKKGVFAYHEEE